MNGTSGGAPLADCQIVLRASQDGSFVPIDETTTDDRGRFSFSGLATDGNVVYLPGVNRDEVHYPGTRVRLQSSQPTADVKLVAYDAIDSPSPLVVRHHEIAVELGAEYISVAETVVIDNPTLTAYVGQGSDDRPPDTLRLSLPEKLEQITFQKEFHGRNFRLEEKNLITDLPWRPGKQEVKVLYRLPPDQKHELIGRQLDLPTDHVVVRVSNVDAKAVTCNLPRSIRGAENEVTFESTGSLPVGTAIELRLGSMPLGFNAYARWTAGVLLGVLILGTTAFTYRRQRSGRSAGKRESITPQGNRRPKRSSKQTARV